MMHVIDFASQAPAALSAFAVCSEAFTTESSFKVKEYALEAIGVVQPVATTFGIYPPENES